MRCQVEKPDRLVFTPRNDPSAIGGNGNGKDGTRMAPKYEGAKVWAGISLLRISEGVVFIM